MVYFPHRQKNNFLLNTTRKNKMNEYISIDDNCSEYFTMIYNKVYKDKFYQTIHLTYTIAIIYK